jgi:hypothetical protein
MSNESQARWYATKLILVYLSIISIFTVIAYIDLFWLLVVLVSMFVFMVIGAIYRDAYYDKLRELEVKKNDQSNT